MKTGFRGTFVISWAQTELDGERAAPLADLAVGTAWRWTGEAVRVDGPAGILPLGEAEGMADLRRRAANGVRRLLGTALDLTADQRAFDDAGPLREAGFIVTDGRDIWTVTLIDTGPGKLPLAMVAGEIPPRDTDLWVVRHSLNRDLRPDLQPDLQPGDAPGGMICFTPGTLILTEAGPMPVEQVHEGTRVQTKDDGCAAVLWTGQRRISGGRLHAMPHLAPVRLRAGALDRGVPDAGLLVSPDHRLLLRGARARALFNTDEVLVAARDLVNDHSIRIERSLREVTYIHLLLPRHQVVFANGVEAESFHPASAALATMEAAHLAQMTDRLPALASDPQAYGGYARRVLGRSEAAILRHDMPH